MSADHHTLGWIWCKSMVIESWTFSVMRPSYNLCYHLVGRTEILFCFISSDVELGQEVLNWLIFEVLFQSSSLLCLLKQWFLPANSQESTLKEPHEHLEQFLLKRTRTTKGLHYVRGKCTSKNSKILGKYVLQQT